MADSVRIKNAKSRAKIRAAKAARAAKDVPVAILLKKKAECDLRALKIVEMMTEKNIDVDWMLENLGWINRSHLEDITEERAIVKLCGYPLCDNTLTKIINKRYHISTIRNKVYDIEKTKNYCSYSCYLSTNYLINQMLTSPLWIRDEEIKPKFKILDKMKIRSSSPPGVEVKLITLDLPSDSSETDEPEEKLSSSSSSNDKNEQKSSSKRSFETQIDKTNNDSNENNEKFTKNECKKMKKAVTFGKNEVREFETTKTDDKNIHDNDESDDHDSDLSEFNDDEKLHKSLEKMVIDDENNDKKIDSDKINENSKVIKKSIIKKTNENNNDESEKKSKINRKNKKLNKNKDMSFESLVSHVEKSFTQWITNDTIAYLHGEPLLKQQVMEKVTRDEKFNELCKKLDLIEIEEEKEARMMMKKSTDMKPLPDYDTLKEQSKNIEIKVKAFYQGQIDPAEVNITENKIDVKNNDTDDSFVPLTDANDAIALRRRIFLNNLNHVIPDLLQTLTGPDNYHRINSPDRTTLIKTLVYTFNLSASNISFKTAEWNLVGLLIIQMLSAIDPIIKNLLSMKKASTYIAMILTIYNLSSNYLDILVSSLTSPRNITN